MGGRTCADKDPEVYKTGSVWDVPHWILPTHHSNYTSFFSQTNLAMTTFRYVFTTENSRSRVTQFNPSSADHSRVDGGAPYPTFDQVA